MRLATRCLHGHTPDTCGPCGEDAHVHAVNFARALLASSPTLAAMKVAKRATNAAGLAFVGFQTLRENGVPLWQPANLGCSHRRCRACRTMQPADAPCAFASCPGRRVRCQLPEVRR